MTQEELQDLSRRAAALLKQSQLSFELLRATPSAPYSGAIWNHRAVWLHESTEACAEIMVQVLWPENVTVVSLGNGCAPCNGSGWIDAANKTESADPMQAFRTAVLLALVEVMG